MNIPHSSQLHFWYTRLDEDLYDNKSILLLSAEEVKRAHQLKFALHSKRFITARAALRSILSLYLNVHPKEIKILHTPQGKPYVEDTALAFNLSHSHDLALYVFVSHMRVGIDIEKIQSRYNEMVAKRFFSPEELKQLSTLAKSKQVDDFYRIWSGKEAFVKAQGEKLSSSLSTLTLPAEPGLNKLIIKNNPSESWYLENLDLFPDYHAAVVTNKMPTHYSFWEWTNQGQKKWLDDLIRTLA